MNKTIKKILIVISFFSYLFLIVGCSEKMDSSEKWIGNYSETYTRKYGYYSEEVLKELSPNGEKEIRLRVVLSLEKNSIARMSLKYIDGDSKIEDIIFIGVWELCNDIYSIQGLGKVSNIPDRENKIKQVIKVAESKNSKDYYIFGVSRKGNLFYLDNQKKYVAVSGNLEIHREWIKIF